MRLWIWLYGKTSRLDKTVPSGVLKMESGETRSVRDVTRPRCWSEQLWVRGCGDGDDFLVGAGYDACGNNRVTYVA